jgi:hypothetical protein
MPESYAAGPFVDTEEEFLDVKLSDCLGEGIKVSLKPSEDVSVRIDSLFVGIIFPKFKLFTPASSSATIEKIIKTTAVVRAQFAIAPTESWSSCGLFDMVVFLKYGLSSYSGTYHF